jgi:hypothetical protein
MEADDASQTTPSTLDNEPGVDTVYGGVAEGVRDLSMIPLIPESNPHVQLIETICSDVLPNMVRLYDSKKMVTALNRNQFEKIIEQKVERAKKSLKMLPVQDQSVYRVRIDQAYAECIDRLHGIPGWKNPVAET